MMDDVMDDAHGEDESPQSSDNDMLEEMTTPPEMPQVDDDMDDDVGNAVNDDQENGEFNESHPGHSRYSTGARSSTYLLNRSIPQPKWDINELRGATMQVAFMRQKLFDVKEPIELKADEFAYYFPYVDNVWVRQHKSRPSGPTPGITKGVVRTDYYACRLQRPTYTPRKPPSGADGKPLRKKKTREGGTCKVRLRAVHYEGGVHAVTLSRVGEHEHSHYLEDMDKMKRNSVIMDIARSEVMRGFMPASVFNVMSGESGKLAVIGGKYMTRSDVRNASQAWRASQKGDLAQHPGYTSNDPIGPTLAPKSTPAHPVMPQIPAPAAPQQLPADTLHFNPAMHPFLEPYLPRFDFTPPSGGLPHVTLTYATSLDSFLALGPGVQTNISGPATKAMTHYLRSRHDAIMIGVGTAAVDNPTLNCRLAGAGGYGGLGWALHPRPIILDPLARWQMDPKNTKVLRAAAEGRGRAPWIIVAPGFHLDPARTEMLKFFGGKYLGLPDVDPRWPVRPRLRWDSIFRALAGEGIRSIMIEGGGSVINDLLNESHSKLISSLIVTVSPQYMGMGGVVVCPNRSFDPEGKPKPVARFSDVRWCPMGEDVVMTGRFAPDAPPPVPAVAAPAGDANATSSNDEQQQNGESDQNGTNGQLGSNAPNPVMPDQQFGQSAEVVSSTFNGTAS